MVSVRSLDDYISVRDLGLIRSYKQDFAYVFCFYITSGPEFREKAKKDKKLKQKYKFMKKSVFEGEEYGKLDSEGINKVFDNFAKKKGLEKDLENIRNTVGKMMKFRDN